MRPAAAIACFAPLSLMACAAGGDVARFEEGMARTGCIVASDAQAAIVENYTGFDDDKLRQISNDLLESGALVREGDGIKLTTGKCANA